VCSEHCVIVAQACEQFCREHWRPDVVISGACRGADTLGEHWAETVGIPVERHPADWAKGPSAGPIRNQLMVDLPHAFGLVVVRFHGSKGSADILRRAEHARAFARKRAFKIIDMVLP
jgi:hypothetical protein